MPEVNAYIEQGNRVLGALGFTEHSRGHAVKVNIINLRKKWKGICSQVPFIVLKYRQGCI